MSPSAVQYRLSEEGGCLWCLCGVWVLSEGSSVLSGGDSIRTSKSVSVALFSCRLVSQCLPILFVWGKGVSGCCLGHVWVSSGWCLGVAKGVIVTKQVRTVQLVPYHATTTLSPSAFNCYLPMSLLLATLARTKGRGNIWTKFFWGMGRAMYSSIKNVLH